MNESVCVCGEVAVYRVTTMKEKGTGYACNDPTHLGELTQRLLSVKPRDAWSTTPIGFVTRRLDAREGG